MAKKEDLNFVDLEEQELPSEDSGFGGTGRRDQDVYDSDDNWIDGYEDRDYQDDGYGGVDALEDDYDDGGSLEDSYGGVDALEDDYDDNGSLEDNYDGGSLEDDYDGGDYRIDGYGGGQDDFKGGGHRAGDCQEHGKAAGTRRPDRRGRVIGTVLIVAGALCLIVGAGILVKSRLDARRVQEQMEVLRRQVELDASRQEAEESSVQAASGEQQGSDGNSGENAQGGGSEAVQDGGASGAGASSDEIGRVPNPYADSFNQNSDMAAWLKIEGTRIDYPVMQTMEDENYYLKRGFDKKSNQNGCLILDTDSTITGDISTNQIIHGHNMKSGEMFGTLTKYEDEAYCEEHKYIKLYTRECERNYEVIAVFRSQVYKKTDDVFKFYKFFQADTQEEFDDWYDNIKALSKFDTGVTAEFGDRFLTLSTCVYHVENGRLVVVAKEIEPGDCYEQ